MMVAIDRALFVIISRFLLNVYCASKIKENCEVCRDIVKQFEKGMEDTAKNHFGGGDTAWEESRLGSYARSETRLLEILEKVCRKAKKEARCDALVEEYEEDIEKFWFDKKKETSDLERFLCIDTMKACCPDGTYGNSCKDCPTSNSSVCSGHGKCKGSGTRTGTGKCKCDDGYTGDLCDGCEEGYYQNENSACFKCHESCDSCTDGTNKGCDECADGYELDEENGCEDKDECAGDASICKEEQFCFNTKGSYRCHDCDPACEGGCTNSGRLSCKGCTKGWKEIGSGQEGCEDIDECVAGEHSCQVGTYCHNTEGSFECKPCHKSCSNGCNGADPSQCNECADGYNMSDDNECIDVNQCIGNSISCAAGQTCVNKDGPDNCEPCHSSCMHCVTTKEDGCLACHKGFVLINNKCKDFDECNTSPCNKETERCVNSPGSYKCLCKPDYARTKKGNCIKKKGKTKKYPPPPKPNDETSDEKDEL